jgi:hypothetical protein
MPWTDLPVGPSLSCWTGTERHKPSLRRDAALSADKRNSLPGNTPALPSIRGNLAQILNLQWRASVMLAVSGYLLVFLLKSFPR